MALNCGIAGLPNVGKSTIFSALTSAPAEAANYPFCTINPNIGIVDLPDERLDFLFEKFASKRRVPASVEFVDIAGLVKGASKGEGLGNQFLAHIREVGILAHVVRCFDNDDIVHVANKIDPADDIETINMELAFADLDTVEKRIEKANRAARVMGKDEQKKAAVILSALDKIKPLLENGKSARFASLTDDEKEAVYDLHLITMKPQLYVCNTDEEGAKNGNRYIETVKKIAASERFADGSASIISERSKRSKRDEYAIGYRSAKPGILRDRKFKNTKLAHMTTTAKNSIYPRYLSRRVERYSLSSSITSVQKPGSTNRYRTIKTASQSHVKIPRSSLGKIYRAIILTPTSGEMTII